MVKFDNLQIMRIGIIIICIIAIIIIIIWKYRQESTLVRLRDRVRRENRRRGLSNDSRPMTLTFQKNGIAPELEQTKSFTSNKILVEADVEHLSKQVKLITKAIRNGQNYIEDIDAQRVLVQGRNTYNHSASRGASKSSRVSSRRSHDKRTKEHGRRRSRSRHSPRRPHHSRSEHGPSCSCQDCLAGGIGARCIQNGDCACGLACEGNTCVCSKPAPPANVVIQATGAGITLTWTPVLDADYYNVFLFNENFVALGVFMFYTNTVITFDNLPGGTYTGVVFAGSTNCGSMQQFTTSTGLTFFPIQGRLDCPLGKYYDKNGRCVSCLTNDQCDLGDICSNGECVPGCNSTIDCPDGEICQSGRCVTPQCTIDSNCPLGQYCNYNSCVQGCATSDNCPPNTPNCWNGSCLQCLNNDHCPADNVCSGNSCTCALPAVTGVSVSGSWPDALQFVFDVSEAQTVEGSYPFFSFSWESSGSNGQTVSTGYVVNSILANNTWTLDGAAKIPLNVDCDSSAGYGCVQSGCETFPASNVVFKLTGLTVTNSCGRTSDPSCWEFASLCPGGPLTATRVTC